MKHGCILVSTFRIMSNVISYRKVRLSCDKKMDVVEFICKADSILWYNANSAVLSFSRACPALLSGEWQSRQRFQEKEAEALKLEG
jgi:hypothetical protein